MSTRRTATREVGKGHARITAANFVRFTRKTLIAEPQDSLHGEDNTRNPTTISTTTVSGRVGRRRPCRAVSGSIFMST